MEKKKVIIDIIKPEDIDNMNTKQWMHFTCKKCGKNVVTRFMGKARINCHKRMLCKGCNQKQTNIERYGVDHPMLLSEVQEKHKQTLLENHGVEYALQSPEIQEKYKQTLLENHGVEHPASSPEIQEKIKQTNIKRYGYAYGLQSPTIINKRKRTNNKKYGVENPFQSPEIQEKIKQTNIKRYGVKYTLQASVIREKSKQTCIEKYGVENPFQSPEIQEKYKQTLLENHGVEHPASSPEIQEKIKQTNIKRYGVENLSQSSEIQEKMHRKYEYFGLRFDSSWELYYYIYQTKILKVKCVRNYGEVCFEYTVNGKLHRYIPDFITESKIVEIKGDHLIDDDNNLIDFYKNQDKDVLLAKTQCMFDNADVIITRKEITPMIKEVKRLFGAHYIDQFKINKDEEGLN